MDSKILEELTFIIKERKQNHSNSSYVSKLIKKGKVKIANKFGEEAYETCSAFLKEGKKEVAEETADLLFHLLILLEESDVSIQEVFEVLRKRMKND